LWQAPSQDSRAQDASIDTLNSDIADLITVSRSDFAQNPYDNTIQTRLKALLDLQSILQNQKLPPEQLAQVRDQVTKLSTAARPPPAQAPVPIPVPVTQQPLQHPTLASLLGQGGLAALLARSASATPQIPTPPTQVAVPIRSPQPQYTQPSSQVVPPAAPPTQAATPDPTSLLERLRAAGMLPATPAATSTPPIPTSALSGTVPPGFPPSLAFLGNKVGVRPVLAEIPNDVQLDPRSLKMYVTYCSKFLT
jgi:pre-mRNA cleavage complex 2 protein Pcf11